MTDRTRLQILALAERRNALLASLIERPSGLSWCHAHTSIADEVVALVHEDLIGGDASLPPVALIATGGYGRRELAPFSDIDITVVPSHETSPDLDQAIRRLFQDLHWAFCTALKLNVGYAYRLVADAAGLDANTRTGLLDMRLVAGSVDLMRALDDALLETFFAGEFIAAKIIEREAAFAKYHDTPLVVEPHGSRPGRRLRRAAGRPGGTRGDARRLRLRGR